MGQGERGPQQPAHQRPGTINIQCQKCPLLANVPQMWELSNWQNKDFYAKKYWFLKFQLAIPQLLPGGQFPFSYSTGQPIPGYYIPQPIAQVRIIKNITKIVATNDEENFDEGGDVETQSKSISSAAHSCCCFRSISWNIIVIEEISKVTKQPNMKHNCSENEKNFLKCQHLVFRLHSISFQKYKFFNSNLWNLKWEISS